MIFFSSLATSLLSWKSRSSETLPPQIPSLTYLLLSALDKMGDSVCFENKTYQGEGYNFSQKDVQECLAGLVKQGYLFRYKPRATFFYHRLTVSGERFCDTYRGANSQVLEHLYKEAVLTFMQNLPRPYNHFENFAIPRKVGIGDARQGLLLDELKEAGLLESGYAFGGSHGVHRVPGSKLTEEGLNWRPGMPLRSSSGVSRVVRCDRA